VIYFGDQLLARTRDGFTCELIARPIDLAMHARRRLAVSRCRALAAAVSVVVISSFVGATEAWAGDAAPPAEASDRSQNWAEKNLPGHWLAPQDFVFHSPMDPGSWKVGAYVGIGNGDTEVHLLVEPWHAARYFQPHYMFAIDGLYKAVEFPNLPLELDVDVVAAEHFGPQVFSEFAIAPMLRWNWFPWNNYVYTTFGLGPLGFSYTTQLSQWEATQVRNDRTTQFMNYGVEDLTFAPSPESRWEVFIRMHHRSGINGFYNHVTGGSNYVATGVRVGF
jgi:hypothetical protein